MLARKGNKTIPIINNQESDKVIIDGLMTTEDLVLQGTTAAQNTIEMLKKMYPHNPQIEEAEKKIMQDEFLQYQLEKIGVENKEQIEAYYANQVLKDKILKTKNEIERLNKKYENEKENNLIYEKEAKIKELEDTILQLKSKLS